MLKSFKKAFLLAVSTSVIVMALVFAVVKGGSLTPPGPVGSTMHSLQEIYDTLAGNTITFTGSGLNDMTINGTFTGPTSLNYRVQIDAAGSPDTFEWSDDGGATWDGTAIAITGGAQTLNNGVTITFGAITGHTLSNRWDFYRKAANINGNIIEQLKYISGNIFWARSGNDIYNSNSGNVGIGTASPSAYLTIKAGTTAAGTAPLKFTSGASLTTPEAGALEFNGSHLYFTSTTPTRYQLAELNTVANGKLCTYDSVTGHVDCNTDSASVGHSPLTLTAIGAVPNANGMSIDGSQVLNLQPADASFGGVVTTGSQTFAGDKTFNGNTTIAADKSLKLTGGASFPASPSEGQIFFRTDTKQLYVYENAKWQADRSTATLIVAASDSQNKEKADYVADGTNDQVEINAAIVALPAGGGLVYLLDGTYNIGATVTIAKSNVTLTGSGDATKLFLVANANVTVIVVGNGVTAYSGITISNLQVDGNNANQSGGFLNGILFQNNITKSRIERTNVHNAYNGQAVRIFNSNGNVVTNNTIGPNGWDSGVEIAWSSNNIISTNNILSASRGVSLLSSSNNTVIGNTIQSNSTGIQLWNGGSINNSITGNIISNSNWNGMSFSDSSNYNTVSSNVFINNSQTTNNTYNDINISGNSTYNIISSNTIQSSAANKTKYGIEENESGSDYNTIANNTITGPVTAGILAQGAHTTVAGNKTGASGEGIFDIQAQAGATQTALTVTQSGTGNIVNLTDNSITSGKGIYLANQKSAFTGNALEMDIAQDQQEYAYRYEVTPAWTDNTIEANSSAGTAYTLLAATTDIFYFGNSTTFDTLNFDIATPATSATLVWEYCSALTTGVCTGWTALAVTDGTAGFTVDGKVTWTDPGALWLTGTVNSLSAKWLRVRATALTGTPAAYYSTISMFTGKFASFKNKGNEMVQIDSEGRIITKAGHPTVVGLVSNANMDGAEAVYVSGNYAYVTGAYSDSLAIVDISKPSSPAIVGSIQNSTYMDYPYSVYVAGKYAYVTGTFSDSLAIIDISNPFSPQLAGQIKDPALMDGGTDGYGMAVYVSGKYAYVTAPGANALNIIDISNPALPSLVGRIVDATNLYSASGIGVAGKYAYVGTWNGRVTVIDISNPASPQLAGSVSGIGGDIFRLFVSGKYVYANDYYGRSLRIVDISNPALPVLVGSATSSKYLSGVNGIYVSGKYAYVVSDGSYDLSIIDVSNPASPQIIDTLGAVGRPAGVFVSGKYAYVSSGYNGSELRVVDISGLDVPSADIGSLFASSAQIEDNLIVGNNLYAQNGINVGLGGIYSEGKISAFESSPDTALTVTQSGTGNIVNLTGNSITSGTGLALSANGLVNGTALAIASTSTALTTGKLFSVDWSPGSATTATGDLVNINIGPNGTAGNLFNITDNGSSLFSVSETGINSNLPHSFTSAGDVSMAYDLLFTNQTASYIKSNAPFYLEAGESFESNNLTLKTYNQGKVVIDSSGLVLTGDITLAADKSLKITGGTSFPSSPTEGQIFFRTDTKQLYIYANAKWQADRSTATLIVAASDSQNKEKADYVADGTNDQAEINAAIVALPAGGGLVYLLDGTYNIGATVTIAKSNVTLAGSGNATKLFISSGITVVTIGDGTNPFSGIIVSDLYINRNGQNGGSGILLKAYATKSVIDRVYVYSTGVNASAIGMQSNDSILTNSTIDSCSSSSDGISISGSNNRVLGNIITSCGYNNGAIFLGSGSSANTISNNALTNNNKAILLDASSSNIITGNIISNTSTFGIKIGGANGGGSHNTIEANNILNSSQTTNNTDDAISISNTSTYNLINGNKVNDTAANKSRYGINENTSADNYNVISNNIISGPVTAGILAQGANTTVAGNKTGAAGEGIFDIQAQAGATQTALTVTQSGTGDILNIFDGATNAVTVKDGGNVGIGDTTPEFKLSLDNDGGIIAIGTFGSGNTLTTSGAGTRMIWYPRKAAFRAGAASSGEWDDFNIGNYSIALGNSPTASGSGAVALGWNPGASGPYSVAMGASANATGAYGIAIGEGTIASGGGSVAIGSYVNASYTALGANYNMVLGQGVGASNRLLNTIDSSLMVGFNSDIPTFFVGPSSGVGTSGNVGIGTSTPGSKLEVAQNSASAALTLTQSGTGNIVNLTGDSITSGTGLALSVDGLIDGKGFYLNSTSTALTTGKLFSVDWSPGSATTATGDLVNINIGQYGTAGNLLNITDNGTSLFSVSETAITSNLPHAFTSAGDVSMAYDLLFTNQTASYIKSNAPLTLEAGESFESNDLTLKTYNQGSVVIDSSATTGTSLLVSSNSVTTGTSLLVSSDGITSGTGIVLSVDGLTTGTGLDISSTSTAGGASGISKLLNLSRSGANTNASHTAYGLYSAVTNTGTTSTNIGGYFSASGATTANYGLLVANGNVGVGTTTPSGELKMDVWGNIRATKELRAQLVCDEKGANCKDIRNTRWSRLSGDGNAKSSVKIASGTNGGPTLVNSDNFGDAVSSIGDLNGDGVEDLAVGAYNDDTGGANRGAVYILFMNANGTVASSVKIASGTNGGPTLANDDTFGESVSSIGDLNGDGVEDLAVGASYDDTNGTDRGAVYILFMNANGTVASSVKIASGTNGGPTLANGDTFGDDISSIGDLNGDGVEDLAVGARHDDTNGTDRGAAYILFMNVNGTVASSVKIASGTNGGPTLANSDEFGRSLSSIGDLNGDGVEDLAVSAYDDDTNGTDRGAVYILFMNANGTVASSVKIASGTNGGPTLADSDKFGRGISSIGDLNGDGVKDLAVGAYYSDTNGTDRGAVYILFMNANGTAASSVKIASGTNGGPTLTDSDNFGVSVSSIGDLNGDGVEDLAVGAHYDDTGGTDRGAVYILFMAKNNIDFLGQNVGIGTATPSSKLDILQSSASSALSIRQDGNGKILSLNDGANNEVLAVSETGQTTLKPAAFDTVYSFDGAAYTDNTTEAKTSIGTPFNMLSLEASSNDEFYLGLDHSFNTAYFNIATAGAGVTLSARYWNGSIWTALTITDNTSNLTASGTVTFTVPADWAQTAVNGVTKYWIDLRSPTTNITTAPTAYSVSPTSGNRFYVYGQSGDSNPSLYINDKGNVGIGTTNLAFSGNSNPPLTIRRDQNSDTVVAIYNATNDTAATSGLSIYSATSTLGFNAFPSNYSLANLADRASITAFNDAAGLDLLAVNGSADIRFYTGGLLTANERIRVDSLGNVGIGTTSPSSKLTLSASGDFAIGDYNANLIDDMEAIADWTASDGTNTPRALEATVVRDGAGAMKITTVAASSNTDYVRKTFGSNQNYSTYERIGFWIRGTQTGQNISFKFYDTGTVTSTYAITIAEANRWQYEEYDISGIASADRDAVSWAEFYIDSDTGSPTFYIDQVRVYNSTTRTSEMFVDNDGNLVVWGRGGVELGRGVPGTSLSSVKIGSANIEINQPLNINVAGDTGMAYDLQFLNTGGANITSQGPLVLSAGDPNKTQNLTLTTQANQASGDSGVSTVMGGANNALTDGSKAWVVNDWANGTIYIISGTGYGQERTVASNTATVITVSSNWTVNPDTTSSYRLAYQQGGDVIVDVANSSNNIGGFKVAGMDNGSYVFRVGPDGNVEIGGNGAAGSNLVVKQNLSLTGGNITINKLSTPANGAAVCGTVASGGLNNATYYYRVSAVNNNGVTLALAEFNSGACVAGVGLNNVTVTWDAVAGATGYKVYGRTTGAELYMATVSAPNLIFVDAGALTPAGALPTSNTTGGDITGILSFSDATNLTLVSDAITVTQTYHTVDQEGSAVDSLSTINGGTSGDILVLRGFDTNYLVTAKDGVGNLKLAGDFAFTSVNDTLTLLFNGTNWLEIARATSGADIAESYYTYDLTTEAGDIVSVSSQKGEEKLGESRNYFIEKTAKAYSSDTLGIVSTNPFTTMGGGYGKITDEEGNILAETRSIALAGRVPAKVNLENGKIETGDFLTSSSVAGVAMKATRSGRVIGRALEPFDGTVTECGFEIIKMENEAGQDGAENAKIPQKEKETVRAVNCKKVPSEIGKVMTFVQPGWYEGDGVTLEWNTEGGKSSDGLLSSLAASVKSGLGGLGAFIENGILKIKSIFVGDITAKKLCIEGEDGERICVEKDQLKELLNKNQITPVPDSTSSPQATPTPDISPRPIPTSTATPTPTPSIELTPTPTPASTPEATPTPTPTSIL